MSRFEAHVTGNGYGSSLKVDGVEVPMVRSFRLDVGLESARLFIEQIPSGLFSGEVSDVEISSPVCVGDTMRVSVPLLKIIHESENHLSELCKVVGIRVEADGSKTLTLERPDPAAQALRESAE